MTKPLPRLHYSFRVTEAEHIKIEKLKSSLAKKLKVHLSFGDFIKHVLIAYGEKQ